MQLKQGKVSELSQYQIGEYVIPYRDIMHPDGLIRIEYYHDLDADHPTAALKFRSRLAMFQNEYTQWKTCSADSLTLMELAFRMLQVKVMNPMEKFQKGTDTRQWFAGSTDDVEEIAVVRFAGLPMNVVLSCHIDERRNDVSGEILRGPFAPGRLSKRGELSAAFQEQYHLYCVRNDQGERVHQLRTRNDGQWVATTQISAPNPCWPHYDSLWANYQGETRPPIHCMVYGDSGTGKSTFATTFPKPMLVWCFDPFGKDMPFWHFWG